jgi:hypothetical protein
MGIVGNITPPLKAVGLPLTDLTGLLPLLKSIHRPTELKKYAGETFGIDGYGWLHRGAIACALELAQGKPTRKQVQARLSLVVPLLTSHQICRLRHAPCQDVQVLRSHPVSGV